MNPIKQSIDDSIMIIMTMAEDILIKPDEFDLTPDQATQMSSFGNNVAGRIIYDYYHRFQTYQHMDPDTFQTTMQHLIRHFGMLAHGDIAWRMLPEKVNTKNNIAMTTVDFMRADSESANLMYMAGTGIPTKIAKALACGEFPDTDDYLKYNQNITHLSLTIENDNTKHAAKLFCDLHWENPLPWYNADPDLHPADNGLQAFYDRFGKDFNKYL